MLCQGKTDEVFVSDWIEVMALERLFLVLGEAVKRLPEDLISDSRRCLGGRLPAREIASRTGTTKLRRLFCGMRRRCVSLR